MGSLQNDCQAEYNTATTEKGSNTNSAAWVALVTAAFFIVLPVHSEPVSFIHGRNVLLSGFFFFLTCYYFLKFIDTGFWRNLSIAVVLFLLAQMLPGHRDRSCRGIMGRLIQDSWNPISSS